MPAHPQSPEGGDAGARCGALPAGKTPHQIGTYAILSRIGTGGMGDVYEALQTNPQRRVALKVIRPDLVSDVMRHRFSEEIAALGRLRHVGIARIYEGGTTQTDLGPQPYFAMELVEGLPLDRFVAAHAPSTRACLNLLAHVADAVHHAHEQDVVHCDLKPGNILVEPGGQPKVLDFGIAHIARPTGQGAADNAMLEGTLPFMSPEQTVGDPAQIDRRSDVYALGVIAYMLLTGRQPYSVGPIVSAAVEAIRYAIPIPLGEIDSRLRGDLQAVVGRALAKDPPHRYQTARALADDLRAVARGETVLSTDGTWSTRWRRLTSKEGNVRQAGWIGVGGYGVVGAFQALYAALGVIAWFHWPPMLPRYIRHGEFVLHTTGWTCAAMMLGYISWRATLGHIGALWSSLAAIVTLFVFAASVVVGVNPYDGAGIMRDPVLRVGIYTIMTALASLGVLNFALAVCTVYRRRAWDGPSLGAIAMAKGQRKVGEVDDAAAA